MIKGANIPTGNRTKVKSGMRSIEKIKRRTKEMEQKAVIGIKSPDVVNHPPHYTQGGIECIEAIESALTPEERRGYYKGNIIKYIWRERNKNGDQDLQKAEWYLKRLLGEWIDPKE